MKKFISSKIKVSWQNKYLYFFIKCLDPFDYLIRIFKGIGYLPKYSVRVRSNGVTGQFGGTLFVSSGKSVIDALKKHAGISADSNVLEIGCGCGRNAFALISSLNDGKYKGIDIDPIVIKNVKQNRVFNKKGFSFKLIDIHNDMYNPSGGIDAKNVLFPFKDESFDLILLISVFTHMKPDNVYHYMTEIKRLLKPEGKCFFSAFLHDYGNEKKRITFPYDRGVYKIFSEKIPKKIIAYSIDYFNKLFDDLDLEKQNILKGEWRRITDNENSIKFPQDCIIIKKRNKNKID